MTVLCADSSCKHCEYTGYYGICKLKTTETPGYGHTTRMYIDTCKDKELKNVGTTPNA